MAEYEPTHQSQVDDPTIGKLVVDALSDIGNLGRQFVELAKSELTVSLRFGLIGVVLFAVAGFLLFLSAIVALITVGYFLTMTGLHPAWAFLIVFGALILIALILAVIGFFSVRKVRAPERTIAQAQQLPQTLAREFN